MWTAGRARAIEMRDLSNADETTGRTAQCYCGASSLAAASLSAVRTPSSTTG